MFVIHLKCCLLDIEKDSEDDEWWWWWWWMMMMMMMMMMKKPKNKKNPNSQKITVIFSSGGVYFYLFYTIAFVVVTYLIKSYVTTIYTSVECHLEIVMCSLAVLQDACTSHSTKLPYCIPHCVNHSYTEFSDVIMVVFKCAICFCNCSTNLSSWRKPAKLDESTWSTTLP